MGLRSRVGDTLVRVGKTFGTSVPASFTEGEQASQMTPASPFSPGTPIGPYDGFDRNPRAFNYQTAYNIATRPRTNEAVSFGTLQGLIGAYDVADICIWHRIDSIRSLKWRLLPADHYDGDVTGAISIGLAALRKPDRKQYFKTWLAKYLYDILAYDAGTLYRMRNRGGRCVGLKVVDGTTIAPLLDYWGDPPDPPAESHVQYVNGLPWNWLTRDDIIYEPFRPRPNSPYGHAPIESILLNANTDLRFQAYFLQRFTDGNLPAAFAASPDTWSPDQIEQFQAYWDAMMYGDQSRKHQIKWMPPGSKFTWSNEKDFTDSFSLFLMRKTCLDEQTEILTRRGWVQFPKLAENDDVATRSADGRFEWQRPTDYIAEPYAGDMVKFKSNSLDLLVTPDHRMLLTYFPTKRYPRPPEFIRTAAEIVGKGGYHIPMRSRWEGESPETFVLPGLSYDVPDRGGKSFHTVVRPDVHIPMKTWMAFLGLWLAEGHVEGSKGGQRKPPHQRGHTHKVGISQSSESPYFDEIQALLDSLPFNWSRGAGHTWVCQDKRLHTYLAPLGNSYDKYIPEEFKNLGPDLLEILWAWACKGDGHHYLGKFWHMITASERMAGDWQEVLQKLGRDASVSHRKPTNGGVIRGREITNCRSTWIVRERTSPLRSAHGEMTPYEGMVYCVSVPNGVIYVRRNGRPAWVGNCASYHVVPSDLGFTENVNRSSGESQADVQHRVGDLPLMEHVEEIISMFLQDDLGLPLKHEFDRGEEQVDQAAQADADQKYMDRAVVSPSEIREMRYGLTDATPVPRSFYTTRAGPIPLSSVFAVSGQVDPQTAAPEPGSPLPHQAFEETPGVQPNPPLYGQPLAEEIYGPDAIPAGAQTARGGDVQAAPVAKEGEAAPAAGITAETGVYSHDLERGDDEGEPWAETTDPAQVAKEMAAFRRFERARRRSGEWRDFEFRAVEPVCGHRLNDGGRLAVRKAAGEVAVAGLAVLAADTGRVLMLQRAICDDDPASGDLEFPGGHLEGQESPLQGAWREWSEETGAVPPAGEKTGEWTSPNGIYRGIVWTTESEASVPVRGGAIVPNPDDPDGDSAEAIMWMDPADLPGNPMVRAELAADLDAVMAALGCGQDPCCGGECCQGGCCGGTSGCSCGPAAEVAKCAFCPDCGGDLDDSGNCMDWQERGERARQQMGIDGTAGDAQDVPHLFAAEKRHAACAACGLSKDAPVHPKAGDEAACPCGTPVVYDESNGWQHADGSISHDDGESVSDKMASVAKAADARPKVPVRDRPGPEPIWGTIEDRRARLTRKHERAILAAWNALTGTLDSRALVREYRSGSVPVAKYADPDRNRALDLAAAWLAALAITDGWTILTAAIGDAIRAAMAEGEVDALAVAASRQGVTGFRIGPAYDAAYGRTGDDPGISRQADDAARKMLEGTAAVVSGVLAGSDDSTEGETSGAVDDAVTGKDVQPVTSRTGDLIWGAIGAGLTWLLGKAGSGNVPAPPPAPGETPPPPAPPVPPSPVFISWITDGNPCLACIDNEQNGPYAPQDIPAFPAHPRCKCNLDFAGDVPSSFFAAYLLD